MQVFDLNARQTFPYEQQDKKVLSFYSAAEFNARIIEFKPGEKILNVK